MKIRTFSPRVKKCYYIHIWLWHRFRKTWWAGTTTCSDNGLLVQLNEISRVSLQARRPSFHPATCALHFLLNYLNVSYCETVTDFNKMQTLHRLCNFNQCCQKLKLCTNYNYHQSVELHIITEIKNSQYFGGKYNYTRWHFKIKIYHVISNWTKRTNCLALLFVRLWAQTRENRRFPCWLGGTTACWRRFFFITGREESWQ